jgi:hypothetical protein
LWKQNLNVDTEIVVKESAEIETAKAAGDFDLIRRGEVLPTDDEMINMLTIFPLKNQTRENITGKLTGEENNGQNNKENESVSGSKSENNIAPGNGETDNSTAEKRLEESPILESPQVKNTEIIILTEAQAIAELSAIPLYFPTSYSLVKPYIHGFEINTLDAPSLKGVKIDFDWQPKKANGES